MSSAQKAILAKLGRQSFVIGIYRWLIEVAFLFAAFTAFPERKWPIGMAVLAFSGGLQAIIHTLQVMHQENNVILDVAERKTRHAIVHAAELAAKGTAEIDQGAFWGEVDGRVGSEQARAEDTQVKPDGFWKGFALASGSLIWQLAASLFGIAIVAGLTGG